MSGFLTRLRTARALALGAAILGAGIDDGARAQSNGAPMVPSGGGGAPTSNPTFTNTVTMPDGGTWTTAGVGGMTALGVGEAAPAAGNVNISGQYQVGGVQLGPTNLAGLGANVATALGVGGGSAFPSIVGQCHLPFVMPSSGTMGNNGALSGITALPVTYANAYVYMPAGAISSGSAAGWYYGAFSSTTAATLFNNVYSAGTCAIPGSPTAFATTGPGAYTQVTATIVQGYALSIAGNTIGPNGSIKLEYYASVNATAGSKTIFARYGGFNYGLATISTTSDLQWGGVFGFSNRGVTGVQTQLSAQATAFGNYGPSSTATTIGSVDSTATQSLFLRMELNSAATDFLVVENVLITLMPGVP